jgi:mitochondrial enoyl-[acyl-carrier protein] reductase / trans-2-enoyl-CoA reductase
MFPKQSLAWIHRTTGSPESVLSLESIALPACSKDNLGLKLLGAPINPADLNMIQGTYPTSSIYGIGGNEGLWQVEYVGSNLNSQFSVGDWVIPAHQGIG